MAFISTQNTSIADRISGVVVSVKDRMQRARVFRTTRDELNGLSGRELADLGIHRSEIRRIAYEAAYKN